jgi:pimeloyl-ACP methyl ester carboxylesterase
MQKIINVKIEELTFDCRVAGDPEGELILFLHGYPETSYMWRNMIQDLADIGFFCVAPNMRGYSVGACPKGKKNYALEILANDILALANHFSKPKFHLVGHDWGSIVGWEIVQEHEASILSWTGMSVPHPKSFINSITNDNAQNKKSSYFKTLQIPFLPEIGIRKNDYKIFRKLWKDCSSEEIEAYLSVFKNPKQLTAAINYYRANIPLLKKRAKLEVTDHIYVPTLFIYGKMDGAVSAEAVNDGHQFMKGEYEYVELETGHWLVETKYQEVKKAIMNHVLKFTLKNK